MFINTINNIELSSICNNSCRYCPSSEVHKHRNVGLMTMGTFDRFLEWLKYFVRKGTQTELNLFGCGESTLNPNLAEMIFKARRVMPYRLPVHLNTNANWVDKTTTEITEEELAQARLWKDAGISQIDITAHDPFATAKAKRIFNELCIPSVISFDPIIVPNNWAGQVDWFNPQYNAGPCPWLRGQGYVLWNGDITRCCIDAFGRGVLYNVFDEIKDIETTPFFLCERCHHTI